METVTVSDHEIEVGDSITEVESNTEVKETHTEDLVAACYILRK